MAREALVEHRQVVQASREGLGIAEYRYRNGTLSHLNVLNAQRILTSQKIAESGTLRAQLVAVVRIYRALGGGWNPHMHRGGLAVQATCKPHLWTSHGECKPVG